MAQDQLDLTPQDTLALSAAMRRPLTDLFTRIRAIAAHEEMLTPYLRQELEVLLRDGYRLLRLADSLSTVECYELTPNAAVFPLWQQLQEVFTPYRSHDKDGLPYQSPGLGLPLARRVLEAHGGSLRLISCEGGTAAVCSLPLCRELPTLLRSTAPHYLEDIFSPLYTILCDYITPPWPYPQP